MNTFGKYMKNAGEYGDILFSISIVFIISILLIPISSTIIDLLFGASVALSIMILVTVLFIEGPLEFSSFPSILLVVTMLRLALNIASTRLILSQGHKGTFAAGDIIEAFGKFVMQGSLVIGIIVFSILTIINFVVITKGSSRIAEVSARFSLDSMPGKQMAIDADLASGGINEAEAKNRRNKLEQESTFFGSMDGASKFVRGDAIAGILITFINFIAGMLIGVIQREMTLVNAAHTYTILTIGDGLISQIPALIVSVAAGMLVTKSVETGSTDKAIFTQLGRYPKAMIMTSIFTFILGLAPGMPFLPFVIMGCFTSLVAYLIWNTKDHTQVESQQLPETKEKIQEQETLNETNIEQINLELGALLLPMIDTISENIKSMRAQLIKELGFITPSIHIKDNLALEQSKYVVRINEIICGSGTVYNSQLLVMNPSGGAISGITGEHTKEPSFGIDAIWIDQGSKNKAIDMGYTVIQAEMVLITHLTEIIKENISDLLSYSATQKIIDNIGDEHTKLVTDIVPVKAEISIIHRVLQNLLSEKISIRNMPAILEVIAENTGQNIGIITEKVRSRLSRQISADLTNENGYIPAITLSTHWEKAFIDSLIDGQLSMAPVKIHEFIQKISSEIQKCEARGESPIVLTNSSIRPYIRVITKRSHEHIAILSQDEIHHKYLVKPIGSV